MLMLNKLWKLSLNSEGILSALGRDEVLPRTGRRREIITACHFDWPLRMLYYFFQTC